VASGLRWTEEQLQAAQRRAPAAVELPPIKLAVKAKYRNRKVENEHGKFDSQKEAQRYAELVLLERAGAIAQLRRQVPFALVVNGIHICDYVADACYREGARLVVEDTKSVATRKERAYRIKVKLMLACHEVEVKET
jgi:hypothetical protein